MTTERISAGPEMTSTGTSASPIHFRNRSASPTISMRETSKTGAGSSARSRHASLPFEYDTKYGRYGSEKNASTMPAIFHSTGWPDDDIAQPSMTSRPRHDAVASMSSVCSVQVIQRSD